MWIIVMAMVVNGELSFSETHDYETKEVCEAAIVELLEKYLDEGVELRKVYAECYRKQ